MALKSESFNPNLKIEPLDSHLEASLNLAAQGERQTGRAPDIIAHAKAAVADAAKKSGSTPPKMHEGGEVPADGIYELQEGEHVLTEDQADKILLTVSEGSPEAGFAKINGSKKIRGATPKPAEPVEPDPEKFAAIGGKFVGKTPERAEEIRNRPLAGAPTTSEIPIGSPWHDAATPILQAANLSDQQRTDLWDIFHGTKDHEELAARLAPVNVPNSVKHDLFMAKAAAAPAPTHTEKVISVLQQISQMDSKVLDTAEKHPNILRAITQQDKGR